MPHDYCAIMHVHSNYSDGTGSVAEIVEAAKTAGVDIVFLTDHDTLQPALDGHAGWHDGVLVVVGTEISPNLNHYLAFGLPLQTNVRELSALNPQEYIKAVTEFGGFGFIAHPDHTGTVLFDVPSYRWEDWSVKGFTGISVWDMMTDFEELLTTPEAAWAAFTNFPRSMTGPKPVSMSRWDTLLEKRRVIAIGEVDNHAEHHVALGQEVTIFPYELAFRTIRLHFLLKERLTGNATADTRMVLDALKRGAFCISFDFDMNARGFDFCVSSGLKKAGMGEEIGWQEGMAAEFHLPSEARVRLFLDGKPFWATKAKETLVPLPSAGVLRLEAYHEKRLWAISNPIWMV